ncbi:DUF192 domain-containing protein [Halosimplex litoreum]|uniref:DUF192 domain-containing protein n=1 Tax=Halosimplex litoreum TaxID=1198301 RepID=A0A7T3KX37_9EURY|nr:DUF192 domain-containing protein [Halosimplex litoreum]QPV64560.1 DUF192 domain-containing protein [Halosimplex litoreum]
MRRRAFLAACVAAGVAGCRGDGASTDGGTDDGGAGLDTTTDGRDEATSTGTSTPTATATETEGSTPTGTPTATASPSAAGTVTDTGTGSGIFPGYETTTVRATTPDGERLGAVTAAIADTGQLRYTGLSDTESLPEDMGMLFVYDEVGSHTYVMREMDFGLDIVYADDEGAITEIHHAPAPGPDEDGGDQTYPGRGQYVFEVNRGWTADRGVEVGDVLRFDL